MFSFCIRAFNGSLMQGELISVNEQQIVRFYQELSVISVPDDQHLQEHLDIL